VHRLSCTVVRAPPFVHRLSCTVFRAPSFVHRLCRTQCRPTDTDTHVKVEPFGNSWFSISWPFRGFQACGKARFCLSCTAFRAPPFVHRLSCTASVVRSAAPRTQTHKSKSRLSKIHGSVSRGLSRDSRLAASRGSAIRAPPFVHRLSCTVPMARTRETWMASGVASFHMLML